MTISLKGILDSIKSSIGSRSKSVDPIQLRCRAVLPS